VSRAVDELLAAMRAAGIEPAGRFDLAADGKLVRYRVDGDKGGSRNGWAVLHDGGGRPWAVFGSWRTGEQHTWQARPEPGAPRETAAQRAERERQARAARAQRDAEQERVRAEAQTKAERLWARARPAAADHPYALAKAIKPYGARRLRDMLLVPARDSTGRLHTLQFISPDGAKRFLTGGRIQGCYFSIGRPTDRLLLAEGFATACSLHEATGAAVAACFSAGNLLPVALALRAKFPRVPIVVCADNDIHTAGNPGVTAARAAARAVRGLLAVPHFDAADIETTHP
jgi:putative DNA primase/helicase